MALVIYSGAHIGHDPQQVPIGGGAAVGHALIRRWAQTRPFELIVLGTGPSAPDPRVMYHQIGVATDGLLTNFSVPRYAQLAREFEKAVTDFLTKLAAEVNPRETLVLHNDIVEAGDFKTIARMGYRQAAIFHVDVVDYTASIYLKGLVSASTLARLWRSLEHLKLAQCAPDVLKLIFQKQEACARYCERLIVPSSGMAQILRASYPWRAEKDVLVIPWGVLVESVSPEAEQTFTELRRKYDPAGRPVLLTLSRISPEKGQDLLLRALQLWEKRGGGEILLFICGAAAYMHGATYFKRLQKLATRLKKVEVIFPGHVGGAQKCAFFRLANLYVFPSRHESYGLTMMEAMAAGLPVLTTAHHSARDLVQPEFGLVVEPTPPALCAGLQHLLARREQLKSMGEKAQKFALSHPFWRSADALAQELLGLSPRVQARLAR